MRSLITSIVLLACMTVASAQQATSQLPPAAFAQAPAPSTSGPTSPTQTTPTPDPTRLTQEAVDRAVANLKEIFGARFEAQDKLIERLRMQLDGRTQITVDAISELRILLEQAIKGLSDLTSEQFKGVASNFAGRDVALAAALLAQKTAVDEQNKSNALSISKSDAATAKQIDTIAANIDTKTGAISDKVADLSSRVQAIESRALGVTDNRDNNSATFGYVVGAIGALAALLSILGAVIVMSRREQRPQPPVIVNGNGKRV